MRFSFSVLGLIFICSIQLYAQDKWVQTNPSPFAADDLEKISFLSDHKTGFALGREALYKTKDAGNSWQQMNDFVSENKLLIDFHFLDELNGFVVGQWFVYRTKDGGITWEVVHTKISLNIWSVFFSNKQSGWVSGTTGSENFVIRTEDGGNSWKEIKIDCDIRSLFFLDDNNGFAVGMNGCALKTSDGGFTWDKMETRTANSLYSIYFLDNKTGFISGSNASVLKTIDGGETWEENNDVANMINMRATFNSISFRNNTGIILGESKGLYSSDRGVIWRKGDVKENEVDKNIKFINSAFLLDSKIGLAVGSFGSYFKTVNGGATWQEMSKGYVANLRDVQMINEKIGFALSSQAVLKTIDNGITWTRILNVERYSMDYNFLRSFYMINENFGYAVGNHGDVVKISMSKWEHVAISKDLRMNDVFFVNALVGVCAGDKGNILRTLDGGNSWKATKLSTDEDLNSVHFIDPLHGTIAAQSGHILTTSDGGNSWKISKQKTGNLFSAFMISANEAFCVGNDGALLHTLDGGDTWSFQKIADKRLVSVFFSDANNGIIVGQDIILETTDNGKSWTRSTRKKTGELEAVWINKTMKIAVGSGGRILTSPR